jgi:SAM-dependent methyltransferase
LSSQPLGYDAELRRHNEALRQAAGVRFRDHVLDIGCGAGQTTRQAGRAAAAGSALGVDVSPQAIERARELTGREGPDNVTFEQADAQTCPFPAERFNLVISRFGTMFFTDAGAAFANVRSALSRAGRLVMMVWQAGGCNEWDVTIRRCLPADDQLAALAAGGSDPFSLAEPPVVTRILESAGFTDVAFADVHEPVYYGQDVAAALYWVLGFACTTEVLSRLDSGKAESVVDCLRAALSAHLTRDGVWFDSRAWIVTARRG